jgi:HEAT repeat protein
MSDDSEVVRQIAALHIRAGSPPDVRQRDRALEWLVAHVERSLPVALAAAEAAPQDVVLIDLLGQFRRHETTSLLARALADARTRTYAANGLGMSPDPDARDVLRQSMESVDPKVVVSALGGLAASGDPSACADITPKLKADDPEVRWMAVEAGCRLGCLGRARLDDIARHDPDADVRALAVRRLG